MGEHAGETRKHRSLQLSVCQVAGKDLMQRSSQASERKKENDGGGGLGWQVDGLDCPDPRPSPKQKLRILALAGRAGRL